LKATFRGHAGRLLAGHRRAAAAPDLQESKSLKGVRRSHVLVTGLYGAGIFHQWQSVHGLAGQLQRSASPMCLAPVGDAGHRVTRTEYQGNWPSSGRSFRCRRLMRS